MPAVAAGSVIADDAVPREYWDIQSRAHLAWNWVVTANTTASSNQCLSKLYYIIITKIIKAEN